MFVLRTIKLIKSDKIITYKISTRTENEKTYYLKFLTMEHSEIDVKMTPCQNKKQSLQTRGVLSKK